MRILLDLRECTDPWTGMGRFGLEVTAELVRTSRHQLIALLPHGSPVPSTLAATGLAVLRTVPSFHPLEHLLLPRLCRRERVDHLHGFTYASPAFGRTPASLTLFDLIPHLYPTHYRPRARLYWRLMVPRTVRRAQAVVTLSNTVRQMILDRYRIAPQRVMRLPFGVGAPFTISADAPGGAAPTATDRHVLASLGVRPPYLLCHGNGRPHKNVAAAIEAHRRLSVDRRLQLVLSGTARPAAPTAPGVITTGRIDDATLAALYRSAAVYVLPSLHEGAGLTPLEAMACGAPVVASTGGALAELYRGVAHLTAPTAEGLAQAIGEVLDQPALRERLVTAGHERAAASPWSPVATALLDAIEATAG